MSGRLQSAWQARLVRRAAAGDPRAFRSLFRALYPTVHAWLGARLAVAADVDDLTAAVFHRVVERLPTFDPRRGTPRAWVLAMARTILVDHLRARRDHAPWSEIEEALGDVRLAPAAHDPDPRIERLRTALQAYPAPTRELLALRFGDGLRYREIAVVLDTTEAAIKQRFSRILRELRRRARTGELDDEVAHAH